MAVRRIAILVYAVLGTLSVAGGILALLDPSFAVPPGAASPLTWHLVREQGSEGIFIGLMFFWCARHFAQRRAVHFALLLFAALFAGIHWAEYFSGRRELLSPVLNSLPLLLLAVTAPWFRTSVPAEAR
jgi:hypothetical protein